MKANAIPIALGVVLSLSACSVKLPSLGGGKPGSTASGRAIASASAPVLTDDGLGSLNALSAFEEATVRGALNRFDVNERLLETPQGLKPVLQADYEGEPSVEVYADPSGKHVARIDLIGPALKGPDGLRVGSELRLQPREGFACAPGGPDGLIGRVICARGNDTRVTFIYDHDWDEDDNVLPPPEVLVRARLERMIWTAKKT